MEGEIYYPSYTLEREINNFINVWISVVVSLCYCYYFSANFINLGGTIAFFIAWLPNFKLLLFAFGKGPLSDPSIPLSHFIAIACSPIKIQPQNHLQT